MKNWIVQRLNFLDNYLPGTCSPSSLPSIQEVSSRIRIHSNSFDRLFTIDLNGYPGKDEDFRIEVLDNLGRILLGDYIPLENERHSVYFPPGIACGTYFVRLTNSSGIPVTIQKVQILPAK
jgi:hypothetical protein